MLRTLLCHKRICFCLMIASLCWLSAACSLVPTTPVQSRYIASANPMQDVQNGLDTAKVDNKLLLLVMGAQWCHDSRGLADKFSDKTLLPILEANYHTVFVDIGYYKNLTSITQRFEQAHYYATPTVLIIDPVNEHLINNIDMHIWGSADSLSTDTYAEYFTRYATRPLPAHRALPKQHIMPIAQFEAQHAARLSAAYSVLVPQMMAEDKTGQATDVFYEQWQAVKEYRMSLQIDILTLRQQALNEPEKTLVFPTYPAFSWESQN